MDANRNEIIRTVADLKPATPTAVQRLEYAEQQLTGYMEAFIGASPGAFAAGMGMTRDEWRLLRSCGYWPDGLVRELDNYFAGLGL